MIASKAIKIYTSTGEPDGRFVTTVFNPKEALNLRTRLFKRGDVKRVIFKNSENTTLCSFSSASGVSKMLFT
jgi:hypothetical protein